MSIASYAPFRIPGAVDIVAGKGGLPVVQVRTELAQADVYLLGATVTHFQSAGEAPLIWVGEGSPFAEGKAIRGGVPVCFPWFGPHKSVKEFPVHGFARNRSWELDSVARLSDGRVKVSLKLAATEATKAFWAYDFDLRYEVTVGRSLELALTAANTDRVPFSYDDCLHTYFKVGDVAKTSVSGLDGLGYLDRGKNDIRAVQQGDVKPAGEIVNVYMRAPAKTVIDDAAGKRRIELEQLGFKETVVWNLWAENAAKNAEIADGWKTFLCVEAANCLDTDNVLLPGTSHTSRAIYTSRKA